MEPVKRPPSGDPFTPPARKAAASGSAPFRCPMTGEIRPNLPLNRTHVTGPRLPNFTPSQVSRLDPFVTLGLPDRVRDIYGEVRDIRELYDWQKECLADPRLLKGSNFILSLPTGAGKTLVAELLMLRCLLQHYQDAILILPFVAIVQEKAISLAKFEELLGFTIEEYAGSRGRVPVPKRRKARLFICTIEKANILINSLITEKRLHEIGLVIVDELHMLGERRRGTVLEQCLTKLMVVNSGIQVVGMSATLSSLPQLQKFLKAGVYSTNFRPLPLKEFVRFNEQLFDYDPETHECSNPRPAKRLLKNGLDEDGVIGLLDGLIPAKSALVFCPSRSNAENICNVMARNAPKTLLEHRAAEKATMIAQIEESNEGAICPIMKRGIRAGIIYHHSGLTREERVIDGVLCVICATSTLAAGVNLPARRVIVKRFQIGRDVLSKASYLQMIGRAGRAGFDTEGEAYVILADIKDKENFGRIRAAEMPAISSGMLDSNCLEAFVLDLFVLEIARNEDEVQHTLRHSMFEHVSQDRVTAVQQAIAKLLERQMIKPKDEHYMEATAFGRATSNGGFLPVHAQDIHDQLLQTLDSGLILSSHFHLLSMIVPYDIDVPAFNWEFCYQRYRLLSEAEKRLLTGWGMPEFRVESYTRDLSRFDTGSRQSRVYLAMILKMLWEQETLTTIAEKFKVSRGWVANLVTSSCAHANQLVRFTTEIPAFWAFQKLLPDLLQQMYAAAQPSFSQLLQIDCVRRKRAEQLYKAGFKNVGAVARATPEQLMDQIPLLGQPQAARIVASAKFLLRYLVDQRTEELEELGVDAPPDDSTPAHSPPIGRLQLGDS
ncbi:hypothetical protein M3Y99_01245400 [Aphelenchoides fujianensis]|nr:hypothetical protein M3Y99_01245400 [Aphelenchoides fujianensis]